MWCASTVKARLLNKKEYGFYGGQMEAPDKRNIPSPRSAGIPKCKFEFRYLNPFFCPQLRGTEVCWPRVNPARGCPALLRCKEHCRSCLQGW